MTKKTLRGFSLALFLSFYSLPLYSAETFQLSVKSSSNGNVVLKPKKDFTIVNFWASWCTACGLELQEFGEKLPAHLYTGKVDLWLIALDSTIKTAEDSKHVPAELKSFVYYDPEMKTADKFNLSSFPATFVLDKDGKIIYRHNGYTPADKVSEQIIATVQKKK